MRAVREVVGAAQVDEAERLEVRDLARPETGTLRRGEAEEELGRVRDQVGAGNACVHRHLFRKRHPAFEPAAREATAQARDLQQRRLAQPLDGVVDVCTQVAAKQDRKVVRLEHGVIRVAREARRVEEHRLAGAKVVRQVAVRLVGDEALEVRQPPGDGDAEPGRGRFVVALEPAEDALQRRLGLGERLRVGADPRRHDQVVQRRDEHLDAVLVHEPDAVEQVLLRLQPAGGPLRCVAGEAVDELVDADGAEGRGGTAREESATGEVHVEGSISTSERSSCFR